MAQSVAGDLYYELDGQLSEIKRQLRQPSGYPFDLLALKRYLQRGVEGKFDRALNGVLIPPFVHDKTKDGWILIKHTSRRIKSGRGLRHTPFREGLGFDTGYGQEDAEWLLEHQHEIPEEFQGNMNVCFKVSFAETVWEAPGGHHFIPCLHSSLNSGEDRYLKKWIWEFCFLLEPVLKDSLVSSCKRPSVRKKK